MQIKAIKLAGFKSFVDPVTIPINTALTGIVGPNGCGKSNIVDAIRALIGVRSAKELRGESLADLIFNGTDKRKPLSQAAVEIHFDNAEGKLGGEYASYREIVIRREIYRDGSSQYFLNNTACRRKDVVDLFLGTGLGPRSYAIIEQGMISQLIEAKPEELRVYLEEAAGISKYKERRRDTELRIEHTRENMARLNDIMQEVLKQLSHLKRQANQAERYKEFKTEQRDLKAKIAAIQWQSAHSLLETLTAELNRDETRFAQLQAEQQAFISQIEKSRVIQHESSDVFYAAQENYFEAKNALENHEKNLQRDQVRLQQLQNDLQQINQQLDELQALLEENQQNAEVLETDMERYSPELQQAENHLLQTQSRLSESEQQLNAWQKKFEQLNQTLHQAEQAVSRIKNNCHHFSQREKTSQERLQSYEQQLAQITQVAYEEAIQESESRQSELSERISAMTTQKINFEQNLQQKQKHKLLLTQTREQQLKQWQKLQKDVSELQALLNIKMADEKPELQRWLAQQSFSEKRLIQQLSVDAGWEMAVEIVARQFLKAYVVKIPFALASELKELPEGEVCLVSDQTSASQAQQENQVLTLSAKVKNAGSMSVLLENVLIAADLAEAEKLLPQLNDFQSVITADGIWLNKNWLLCYKPDKTEKSLFVYERELQEKLKQLEAISESLKNVNAELTRLEQEINEQQNQFNEFSQNFSQTQQNFYDAEKEFALLIEKKRQQDQRVQEISAQISRETQEIARFQAELQAELKQLQDKELAYEQLIAEKNALEVQKLAANQQYHESKLAHESAKNRRDEIQVQLNSTKNQLHYLKEHIQRTQKQFDQQEDKLQQVQADIEQIEPVIQSAETALNEKISFYQDKQALMQQAKQALDEIELTMNQLEAERKNSEQAINQLRDQREQRRLQLRESEIKCQQYESELQELEVVLNDLLQTLESYNLEQSQIELQEINRKIERLGAINLAAIDEHQELDQRRIYLDQQFKDLEEALATLESAMAKIDQETRSLLQETYNHANQTFQQLFPKIFGGGRADLELTGEDILTSGVLIKAQPPGKRNSTIHLLSGGEKALTTIALVFSLFQLNPAPFCLLDEVDAPLDDANVVRFCNLVKEMAKKVQFLFISHNKITIEMAEELAGVTMSEPGVSRLVAVDVEKALQLAEQKKPKKTEAIAESAE